MKVSVVNITTGTELETDKENSKTLPVRKQNLKHNCVEGKKNCKDLELFFNVRSKL